MLGNRQNPRTISSDISDEICRRFRVTRHRPEGDIVIEDMTIRNLAPKTQQGYIRTIKNLAVFLGHSPATASFEDVRRFQLHVAASGVGPGALNATVAALRAGASTIRVDGRPSRLSDLIIRVSVARPRLARTDSSFAQI
jgi:hypothetical protein